MPLHIQPCADADAARAFEIEHLAYGAVNDPISALLFPGPFPPDANTTRAESVLVEKRANPAIVWLKVVDDELTGEGAMVAFAEWHVYPTAEAVGPKKMRSFGPGSDPRVCEEFFGALQSKREELMGGKGHVCECFHLLGP